MYRRPSSRPCTTGVRKPQPSSRHSRNQVSGKAGAVQVQHALVGRDVGAIGDSDPVNAGGSHVELPGEQVRRDRVIVM